MKANSEICGLTSLATLASPESPAASGERVRLGGRDRLEAGLRRRLWNRLRSTRGSAYIEFAFMMPLVVLLLCFAADFMRCLYVEQQVEISTRALCDIESHFKPGKAACPKTDGKRIIRNYLSLALAKDGFIDKNYVYCKGSTYVQSGIVQQTVANVTKGLNSLSGSDNAFFRVLGKLISGAVKFLTMNTITYVTNVMGSDRVVKTSVSVLVSTAVRKSGSFFGGGKGCFVVPAYAPRLGGGIAVYDRDLSPKERVRYYCHMPSMDTSVVAPPTYIREVERVLSKIPLIGKCLKTKK